MSSLSIRSMLIDEGNYAQEMKEKVLPYINERKTEISISRNEGEKIYCLGYSPSVPKATVVISHGFTESTDKFEEMIYYFLMEGYSVCVFEHCGHGRTYRLIDDPNKVHVDSYKRYTEDLEFVAKAAKAAHPNLPLYLYGHSMGGGIAAAAACSFPDLFDKVILNSPMIRPVTGGFPWFVTRPVCCLFAHSKKTTDYAPGQKPYTEGGKFEDSCADSKARYDYYDEVRRENPLLQMNGATYGWLYAAVQINTYLQKTGWKNIKAPVLLFQAENDTLVINEQQNIFIDKIKGRGVPAELIQIKDTKHEIYRAGNDVLEGYYEKIFAFLELNCL